MAKRPRKSSRKVSSRSSKRTKRAAPTKKRKKTARRKVTVSTDVERQLAVYHQPFSRMTKNPKIPDGKLPESVGFTTQAVRELNASAGTSTLLPTDTLHILMFAGQNCSAVVFGDKLGGYSGFTTAGNLYTNNNVAACRAIGYAESNGFNQSGFLFTTSNPAVMDREDRYAFWRTVSTACKVSLLNPDEANEGWWEACRVHVPFEAQDYIITETDQYPGQVNKCTVAPIGVLLDMINRDIVNQNSYNTGLLRELKNHTFKLNPMKDEHDVLLQSETVDLAGKLALLNRTSTPGAAEGFYTVIDRGEQDWKDYCESVIDQSFDMVYIRIHGRDSATAGGASKVHFNVISNQEIAYEHSEREARFHTPTVHLPNFEEHLQAQKTVSNSSVMNMSL